MGLQGWLPCQLALDQVLWGVEQVLLNLSQVTHLKFNAIRLLKARRHIFSSVFLPAVLFFTDGIFFFFFSHWFEVCGARWGKKSWCHAPLYPIQTRYCQSDVIKPPTVWVKLVSIWLLNPLQAIACFFFLWLKLLIADNGAIVMPPSIPATRGHHDGQ